MEAARKEGEQIPPRLGLFDAVSIIVGVIIGVGIFETPARVFRQVPDPAWGVAVWVIGGLVALVGAFVFAELASTYPRSGGEYVYLTRAYGPWMGYLFAWAQLGVIRTGNIAILGYIFALFADKLWGLGSGGVLTCTVLSILGLTLINILGVTLGKSVQNLLTVLKVLGLGALIVAGIFAARPEAAPVLAGEPPSAWFAEAMILVFFAYGGWQEAAYVAAEVKNGRRNLPLALILGTAIVTVIYLLVNTALLVGLGFQDARAESAVGDLLKLVAGREGETFLYVLAMVSALGGLNGMILTTARIFSELAHDHRLFAPLSKWSRRWGTPVRALLAQGIISIVMAVAVVLRPGRDGFEAILYYTSAVFWLFFLLTGIALFVLRRREPQAYRPFRVPGYPVLPALFCLWCAYLVFGAVSERPRESLIGLGILFVGIPFFFLPAKWKQGRARSAQRAVADNAMEMILPTPARWHVRG